MRCLSLRFFCLALAAGERVKPSGLRSVTAKGGSEDSPGAILRQQMMGTTPCPPFNSAQLQSPQPRSEQKTKRRQGALSWFQSKGCRKGFLPASASSSGGTLAPSPGDSVALPREFGRRRCRSRALPAAGWSGTRVSTPL